MSVLVSRWAFRQGFVRWIDQGRVDSSNAFENPAGIRFDLPKDFSLENINQLTYIPSNNKKGKKVTFYLIAPAPGTQVGRTDHEVFALSPDFFVFMGSPMVNPQMASMTSCKTVSIGPYDQCREIQLGPNKVVKILSYLSSECGDALTLSWIGYRPNSPYPYYGAEYDLTYEARKIIGDDACEVSEANSKKLKKWIVDVMDYKGLEIYAGYILFKIKNYETILGSIRW